MIRGPKPICRHQLDFTVTITLLVVVRQSGTLNLLHSSFLCSFSSSVSDPLHFDVDSDPRIRFQEYGSGSDLKSNKFQFFSSQFFSVKVIKLMTMFFCCCYLSFLFTYIKQNKWLLFKKIIFLFWLI